MDLLRDRQAEGFCGLKTTTSPPRRKDRATGASLSGTNLERASDYNQRVVLQTVRVNGTITRAEIAQITGLTTPTINNITQRLVDDGLVLDVGKVRGARGQPATRYAINPDGCLSIGINIDRDHITVLAMDLLGKVRAHAVKEIPFPLPDTVRKFCGAQVRKILADPKLAGARVIGLGVARPDDLHKVSMLHQPEGFRAWREVDFVAMMAGILPGALVLAENDAAAAALGELQFGHGVNRGSFFYLLLNYGLGGSVVVDGHYVRGARGRSGEIGFLPVSPAPGQAGTLQDYVSLSALLDWLAERGSHEPSVATLREPDEREREAVLGWIEMAADVLIEPLLNVACLLDPEAIFVGGRMPAWITDGLIAALNRRLGHQAPIPNSPLIIRAQAAADAPAVGAAILPFIERLLPSRQSLMKTSHA